MRNLSVIVTVLVLILAASLTALGADMGKPLASVPTFKWRDWTFELSPDGNIQHGCISYNEREELDVLLRLGKEAEERRRREHGVEPNHWKIVYCLSKETDMIYVDRDGTRYRETAGMGRTDLEWALLNEQQYYEAAYGYSRGSVIIEPTDRVMEEPLLGEYGGNTFFWPADWQDLGIGIDSHEYDSVVGHYYPGPTRPWARGGTGGGGNWCAYLGHTSVQFAEGREVGGPLGDLGKITLHEWLHQIDGQKGWKCGYIGLPGQYAPGNYHHGAHLFWMYHMLTPRMYRTMRMQAPLSSPPNKPQDRYDGFISEWLTIGPFDLPAEMASTDAGLPHPKALDQDPIDPAMAIPSADLEQAGKKWTLVQAENQDTYPFRRTYPSPHHDAFIYAHVYVNSPSEREAYLWIGSAEPFAVYLNGHKVLQCWRGAATDEAKRKVVLMAGWNRLLIKRLDQEEGNWPLSCRFTDLEHKIMYDVQAKAAKPDAAPVPTESAKPAPPIEVPYFSWDWPYNDDWFGSLPILHEEHLEKILGVKGVRILGMPGVYDGRARGWDEMRWTLIDVSNVDHPENILSRVVPANAAKVTLQNNALLDNVLNMSRETGVGRSYESMALIRYRRPDGTHGDLVLLRADMIEPFLDLAKRPAGKPDFKHSDRLVGFICRDSKTFFVLDTDLGEQMPINELDMLVAKDETVTLAASPSVPRVLRGQPVEVKVGLTATGIKEPSVSAREFGTDEAKKVATTTVANGAALEYRAGFPVDTARPAGLLTYIVEGTYEKDGQTHTVSKPVPINLFDAVGVEVRIEGPELIQVPRQTMLVTVTNNLPKAVSGRLAPKLPRGWRATPARADFSLARLDERQTFKFDVAIDTKTPDGPVTLAVEAQPADRSLLTCRGELPVYKTFADVLLAEDFENGIGGSFGYTNAHYQVRLERQGSKNGKQYLHIYDRGGRRYGHVACFGLDGFAPKEPRPTDTQYTYDTNVYPYIEFWFKTEHRNDNLGLHVILDDGETGYGFLLNGFWEQQWDARMMIGRAEDFVADGEWHHIVFNVDEALDNVLGDTSHFVRQIWLGDTRAFASGWWYYFDAHHHYLDDFIIRRTLDPKDGIPTHRTANASGVPMYSTENRVPAFDSPIVNGVKATARLTQLGYFPWETPTLQLWVTNLSKESIRVATWPRNKLWQIRVTNPDGTPVSDGWVSAYWRPEDAQRDVPREPGHFRELKPGESWLEGMPVHDLFANWAEQHQAKLEQGKTYLIALRYQCPSDGSAVGLSAWTGVAEANSVPLTLIAMPTLEEELTALTTSLDKVRRAKAAAQLGKAKHVPAIEALVKALLTDVDGDVRLNAAWALGNFDRIDPNNAERVAQMKPVVDALIKALDDPNWRVGEYAATSLSRLGDRSATAPLVKRLTSPSKWVRRRTCDALRDLGDPAAAQSLVPLLTDRSREVRYSALATTIRFLSDANVKLRDAKNRRAEAERRLTEAKTNLDAVVQRQAPEAEVTTAREAVTKAEEAVTAATNEVQPLQAAFDAAYAGAAVALNDEFYMIRRQWIEALGAFRGNVDVLPVLINALNDRDEFVRTQTIARLGEFGPDAAAAVEPIKALLTSKYDFEREAAVNALPKIAGKTIEEVSGQPARHWLRMFPKPASR